ncbi:uncharacterized protein LOC111639903 [Centruroides sculpturatus]|uniref:uncharacterized protein LOC111639903 n=1 Tax=Centruroides sculpturatus TaxID=218467 RepID=UPI000C6EBD02|nr:uncharacterized protein LOC111639903 [Centruroides sculpturatus]
MNSNIPTIVYPQAIATFSIVAMAGYQSVKNLIYNKRRISSIKSIQKWIREHYNTNTQDESVTDTNIQKHCLHQNIQRYESKISQHRMKEISALLIQIWWKTKYTNKQIMQIMKYVESQRNSIISSNILKLKEFIIENILKIFWRLFSRQQKEENESVQKITHDADICWEEMLSCKHHGEVFDNLVIIQARLKGLMERIRFIKICKIQENDQITAKINLWWDKLLEYKYRKPMFNSLICIQAFVIGFIKNLQLIKKVNKVEKEMAALHIQKFWKHFQLRKNGCQISVRITLELQNCLHKGITHTELPLDLLRRPRTSDFWRVLLSQVSRALAVVTLRPGGTRYVCNTS